MTITRLIARPMLASAFALTAVTSFKNTEEQASKAEPMANAISPLLTKAAPKAPTNPKTLVRINAGAQVVAAVALATGKAPRLAGGVLAATMIPSTLTTHNFWSEKDKEVKKKERAEFVRNLALAGGALLAAAEPTSKPGPIRRAKKATVGAALMPVRHMKGKASRMRKLAARPLPRV